MGKVKNTRTQKKQTNPNLKSLIMMRASRPPISRTSSSVTRKARGIQATEGRKRERVKDCSK